MGVVNGDNIDAQFHTDIDVTFSMSGTTDGGLTFGASIDLDEEGGFAADNGGPESVFISGGFGTLTMGDTDGAFDQALVEVGMGGSIADDHTGHGGYSGNGGLGVQGVLDAINGNLPDAGAGWDGLYDGQIMRYDYVSGPLMLTASLEVADDRDATIAGVDAGTLYGFGARYTIDGLTLGFGYQAASGTVIATGADVSVSAVGLSAGYTVDNVEVRANVSQSDIDTGVLEVTSDHVGLGVAYTMDALTVAANWGQYTTGANGFADVEVSGYGLAVEYDLGGGAVVQFGYGFTDNPNGTPDADTMSFGLAMSF